jgi:hypothetical protein
MKHGKHQPRITRSKNMTGRLHALQAVLQRLVAANQGSVREGQDIHLVLYPRLVWEHLLRCSAEHDA